EINVRLVGTNALGISFNETTSIPDLTQLLAVFGVTGVDIAAFDAQIAADNPAVATDLLRTDAVLTHPVFNSYHSETDMLRYLKRLESNDIDLNHSMIPMCYITTKLNDYADMNQVTLPDNGT